MTLVHTPECTERAAKVASKSAEWQQAWPQACKVCGTNGWIRAYDSVPMPFGPGNTLMETGDVCECACSEAEREGVYVGRCPRCRKDQSCDFDTFVDGERACEHCGWQWGKGADDTPPEYECWGDCVRETE